MATIGVIDYKNGNTQSVVNAIEYLGFNIKRCINGEDLDDVSHIILPGVGAFSSCMTSLQSLNLIEPMHLHAIVKKKPFLGICVGMQILVEYGEEFGKHEGLGWVKGKCKKIDFSSGEKLLLPHVGWNQLIENQSMIVIPENTYEDYYFVHSYVVALKEKVDGIASAAYGSKFTVALRKGNIYGVQFHPEKSQKNGLELLKSFCEL